MAINIKPDNSTGMKSRGRQRGQSSAFVVVFIGITLLSVIFLYKAGKLTGEKMELQNAADAAAYSIALLEARDLNFMAYTNRAMVANEVAIGQAVGLASMTRHWRSIGHYVEALCGARIEPLGRALQGPPPTAPVGGFLNSTCGALRTYANTIHINPGKAATRFMDMIIANPVAVGMHVSNRILSEAQTLAHFGTIFYVAKSINDVVDNNTNDPATPAVAPDLQAQLSPWGITLFLGHLKTYGSFDAYNPTGTKFGKFTRTYFPSQNRDAEGFERFASVVGASRDEFTKERGWKLPIIPRIHETPHFTIPLIPGLDPDEPTLGIRLDITFILALSINRRGASEHRFIANKARGDKFNWSSADTTASEFEFELGLKVTPRVCDPTGALGCVTLPSASFTAALRNNNLNLRGQIDIDVDPIITTTIYIPNSSGVNIPFPIDVPYAAAGAQIGLSKFTAANAANYLERLPKTDLKTYYQSPKYPETGRWQTNPHSMAWNGSPIMAPARGAAGPEFSCPFPPVNCTVPVVSKWLPTQEVQNVVATPNLLRYDGLKRYSDTLNPKDLWGFEGPTNIIALQKSEDGLFSATAPDPSGRLRLQEATANNVMGAIAKGEVYFKRSNSISYFKREDGFEERGSAFNPYWQARLAPLSHAERSLATVQQHKQNLESSNLTPLPDNPLSNLPDSWIR
jgi:hypothetical protein